MICCSVNVLLDAFLALDISDLKALFKRHSQANLGVRFLKKILIDILAIKIMWLIFLMMFSFLFDLCTPNRLCL